MYAFGDIYVFRPADPILPPFLQDDGLPGDRRVSDFPPLYLFHYFRQLFLLVLGSLII